MDLSVVIVNWNTCVHLRTCLESLGNQVIGYPQVEVIVVDNASTDGSAQMVRSQFPWVRLIANSENAGYAKGNNQGLVLAEGRFILLLNPDTIVPEGALEKLVSWMDRHPDVGAVGVRLLNPDGSVQPSCRSFPEPAYLLYESLGLAVLFPHSRRFGAYRMTWFDHNREMDVDQPMGSALAVRREALEDVGLLDEQFPLFFNEVDWCYRARQKGWRIVFTPEVEIVHYGGSSTSQVRLSAIAESHRSLVRFYRKHYRNRMFWSNYVLIILSIYAGALVRLAWAALHHKRPRG
ncbi:MAG: glycosyltransferase family 2 protein [Armatimonadota bacterium]